LGTAEPLEQLADDLDVVREGSESTYRETVADCAVAVHRTIADVMMWIIVLRYRSVRDFCYLVCL